MNCCTLSNRILANAIIVPTFYMLATIPLSLGFSFLAATRAAPSPISIYRSIATTTSLSYLDNLTATFRYHSREDSESLCYAIFKGVFTYGFFMAMHYIKDQILTAAINSTLRAFDFENTPSDYSSSLALQLGIITSYSSYSIASYIFSCIRPQGGGMHLE